MFEHLKKIIKEIWGKTFCRFTVYIMLVLTVAAGLYFINKLPDKKTTQSCWQELSTPYVLIEKNYEIYEVGYPGGPYQYFIFDNKHNVLRSGYSRGNLPIITITHGLIRVGSDDVFIYYEPEKGLDSTLYFVTIVKESEAMVAYIKNSDKKHLIVQDIFDDSKYYRTFEMDFSDVENPVIQADFINGGEQLKITYKAGKDKHEVTDILDLYNTSDQP